VIWLKPDTTTDLLDENQIVVFRIDLRRPAFCRLTAFVELATPRAGERDSAHTLAEIGEPETRSKRTMARAPWAIRSHQ
jgi:hypothetical protein